MSNVSMPAAGLGGAEFRVGRVLGQALAVLRRNFGKYFIFGVIIAIPDFLSILQNGVVSFGSQSVNVEHRTSSVYFLINILVLSLCQAAMIYGAFQDIRGRPFDVGTSIRRGLGRFLPVLGTAICYWIAIFVGLILLVLPGLILMAMFMVAIPACVVEGLGPFQSLGRSSALTKGHRWAAFAILLTAGAIVGFGNFIAMAIGGAIGGVPGAAILSAVYVAVTSPYQPLTAIVAYHDLRAVKEGLDIEQLASVFD